MKKFGDPAIDALRAFGANVRRLRLERHYTIEQLADLIVLDPGNLALIEDAANPGLKISTAFDIADALGVPLAQLFEEPQQEFLD